MTRLFATARKTLSIRVRGNTVIVEGHRGANRKRYERTFRNRYTLRRFLNARIDRAVDTGYRPVVG